MKSIISLYNKIYNFTFVKKLFWLTVVLQILSLICLAIFGTLWHCYSDVQYQNAQNVIGIFIGIFFFTFWISGFGMGFIWSFGKPDHF
jgi:hypothetical protein